jgi:hypothetical protein
MAASDVADGAVARGGGSERTAVDVSTTRTGAGEDGAAGAGERVDFVGTAVADAAAFDAGDRATGAAARGAVAVAAVGVCACTGVDVCACTGGERSDMGGMRRSAPPPPESCVAPTRPAG